MESKFDLIERYLMHDMSVKERLQFEELLINDPELQKEFALRKEINNAIQEEDIINLRSELGEMMNKSNSSKTRKIYFYSAVAAIITLVITIGSIYFSPFYSKSNNNDLFQSYYSNYPAVISYRSQVEQNEQEKILHDALKHYEEGEFILASELFRDVLKKDSSNYMSQFYLAICEMEIENFNEAKTLLLELTSNDQHLFWEQAHWYLALVYLKQNENEKAKAILNTIINEEMAQKSNAETILKMLD